jgi:hypothetical protein
MPARTLTGEELLHLPTVVSVRVAASMITTIASVDAARVGGELGPGGTETWSRAVATDDRCQLDHPVGRGDRRGRGWTATDGPALASVRVSWRALKVDGGRRRRSASGENRDLAPDRMAGKSGDNARSI